jgi:hypothetical protein
MNGRMSIPEVATFTASADEVPAVTKLVAGKPPEPAGWKACPTAEFYLFRKCMFCQTVFGTKPCVERYHEQTSHGVCTICAAFQHTIILEMEATP